MKKTKSKAAYTNKWLRRHKNDWHEEDYFFGTKKLVVDKKDAPKVVLERVKEINEHRVGLPWALKQIKALERKP